jgi:hypothetical protein
LSFISFSPTYRAAWRENGRRVIKINLSPFLAQKLLADNTALDQTQGSVSEQLRASAQALFADVQPYLNLEAGDVAMFVMDMPDVPPQYAPVVIAQAPQAHPQAQPGSVKFNRTIGVCQLVSSSPDWQMTAVNGMSPLLAVSAYFENLEQKQVGLEGKVTLLQGPEHGELEDEGGLYYSYHSKADYEGPDRATFLVEIGGYKVKAEYYFKVAPKGVGGTEGYDPYEDRKNCPKGELWKISLNPDDPNVPIYTFQHPYQWTNPLADTIKRGRLG